MVPGYCSKVYVGFSNMNIETLDGVIKVMYPNCYGGLSDEWTLYDVARTGTDCVDAASIYVAADLYGTEVMWEASSTGVVAAEMLKPTNRQGPITKRPGESYAYFGGGPSSYIEAYMVPGMLGKIKMYYSTNFNALFRVSYPNTGNMTVTDGWKHISFAKNDITASFYLIPDIDTEFMLATEWKYQ